MTMTTTEVRSSGQSGPVDVDELKRAWRAVLAGDFRPTRRQHSTTGSADRWTPQTWERPLPVLGCAGSAGATTLALAIGLSVERPARVVECGSVTTSGLAAASTAELGRHPSGWFQGRRDHVLLERGGDVFPDPNAVPQPTPAEPLTLEEGELGRGSLTILDVGWEASQLLASESWLVDVITNAPEIVLTTRATVPGIRRLDGVLTLLAGAGGVEGIHVAVLGPRRKKWPRGLDGAGGTLTRQLLKTERVVVVPEIAGLATAGLDSRPLPPPVIDAASRLMRTMHGPETTHTRGKGEEH